MNASGKLMVVGIAAFCSVQYTFARGQQNPEQFLSAGDRKMQEGRYLDAIEQYSHAIKNDKRNPSYYQFRARAELAASKYKPAVADCSKAIKFAPDDSASYELRAKAYDALKDYKKERADLDKLIAVRPDSGTYLLQRAQTAVELKQMEQVIQDCNHAINLGLDRKQLADLYKMRSVAFRKLGKKTEAEQETSKYQSLR